MQMPSLSYFTYPQYNPPTELTAAAWTTKRDAEKFFTSSLFVL